MKTASRCFRAASALVVALALPANAYNDTVTHPTLTACAVEKSVVYQKSDQEPDFLFRMGIFPSNSNREAVRELVKYGSFAEDDGERALNHFYDPIEDRPLTVLGLKLGKKSWEWMLELPESIGEQQRSLADAHEYIQTALTYNGGTPKESNAERMLAMKTVFLSLGSAVHHMQDMAQPQHVRNDQHYETDAWWGPLIPFYRPSRYEKFTRDQNEEVIRLCSAAEAVFPGAAHLKTAGDFWFDRTEGIAQYTSRHFVSAGTNFKMFLGQVGVDRVYEEPVPGKSSEPTIEQLYTEVKKPVPEEIRALCGDPALDCTMTMYPTKVSSRASTLSIFDQDMRVRSLDVSYVNDLTPSTEYKVDRLFALNGFNFNNAHPVLIPKAISYSAGIINHFFRGKLKVTAPDKGPYAVVSHSTGAGFQSLRASVANATPNEALPAGSLVAIARFHRNLCYKPDLSGEFTEDDAGGLVEPCEVYRSDEGSIRVSQPHSVTFAVDEQKKNLTFQFNEPIPLDATDLVLQVYYQKTDKSMSQEGMFAVGAVDISEPTFVAIMNGTDVFELPTSTGGQFFYYPDIIKDITSPTFRVVDSNADGIYGSPPDVNVRGGDIYYKISIDGQHVGETVIPEGRFARLAVLGKPTGLVLTLTARGNGFNSIDSYSQGSKKGQLNPETESFETSTVGKLRKQTLQYNSVTYYHYYSSASALLKDMPPSKADDATELIPVHIADVPPPLRVTALNSDMPRPPRLVPQEQAAGLFHRSSPAIVRVVEGMEKAEDVARAAPAQ